MYYYFIDSVDIKILKVNGAPLIYIVLYLTLLSCSRWNMKTLMVFDFDHTVVDDNSDTWVIR